MEDTFTVVFKKPEGYEDVCTELCIEDMAPHPDFTIVDFCAGNALAVLKGGK